MLTDAHCHPYDLIRVNPQAEEERIEAGVLAAASACLLEEFVYNESLPNILPYFGIHPQMPAVYKNNLKASHKGTENTEETIINLLKLAKEKRIAAIGECGFDLYNAEFKETEKIQEQLFIEQLEIALQYGLPVIIHARRAMHKIFENTEKLKKCKAVVFHSWPGTLEEASAIIRRGLNVYFSFGNTIKLNHKQVIKSCAHLPADRLLTETDAPFQPRRGERYSRWADLPLILETAAALRCEAGNAIDAKDLELQIEANFKNVFY